MDGNTNKPICESGSEECEECTDDSHCTGDEVCLIDTSAPSSNRCVHCKRAMGGNQDTCTEANAG